MSNRNIRIAMVILENQDGEFALQLRSPIPSIVNPDRWGCFGGYIEEGESPAEAALREIEEELTVSLDSKKLTFHAYFEMDENKEYSIFHYLVKNELDHAVLMEGEDLSYFSIKEIETGEKQGKKIVDYHRKMISNLIASRQLD